jgi:hypothetical protein
VITHQSERLECEACPAWGKVDGWAPYSMYSGKDWQLPGPEAREPKPAQDESKGCADLTTDRGLKVGLEEFERQA